MKRWIFISLAICLTVFVVWLYVSFNGNFITKAFAQKKVEQYIAQTYAGYTAHLFTSGFDFKDGRYYFYYELSNEFTEANYSLSVGGPFIVGGRVFKTMDMESADTVRTEQFEQAGTAWLTAQLSKHSIATDLVEYHVEIPKGLYEEQVVWQPALEQSVQPAIAIEVTNQGQSEAEFLQQVATIQQLLQVEQLTYEEAQVTMYRHVKTAGQSYYEAVYTVVFTRQTTELNVL